MTIKQAVSWLSQPGILAMIHDPTTKKAVQVAIKALSATDTNVGTKLGTNLAEVGTDTISRQAAIDALGEEPPVWYDGEDEIAERNQWKRDIEAIKQLPPIQSIQPKRGKWIKTARWGRVYYCDQCRNYLDFDGVNAGRGSTNYCPNCGADMRGEQE